MAEMQHPEHGGAADAAPYPALSRRVDRFVAGVAVVAHMIWIVLLLAIVANVALRYLFGGASVALEEMQWHLYAAGFLIGLSICLVQDEHVRVDFLAAKWSPKTRAGIELAGLLLLLVPFALVMVKDAIPFVQFSLRLNEVSSSPGGLPHRWLLKAALPVAMGLLVLAALARALRMLAILRHRPL